MSCREQVPTREMKREVSPDELQSLLEAIKSSEVVESRTQLITELGELDATEESGLASLVQNLTEAGNNENGRAPHSAWRNYDDFNEYFWSLSCFDLTWAWRKNASFFLKPTPRSKIDSCKGYGGAELQVETYSSRFSISYEGPEVGPAEVEVAVDYLV